MLNSPRQQTYKLELANKELSAYSSLCGKLSDSKKNAHLSEKQKQQAEKAKQAIETNGYVVPFYQQFCRQVKDKLTGNEKYDYTALIRSKLNSEPLKQVCKNSLLVVHRIDYVLNPENDQQISSQIQESFLKVLAEHDEQSALYYIKFLVDKLEKGLYAKRLPPLAKTRTQFVSECFDECKPAIDQYQQRLLTVDNTDAVDSPNDASRFIEALQAAKQRYEELKTQKDYAGLLQLNSEQNQKNQSNSTSSELLKLQELDKTHLQNIQSYINHKNEKMHIHSATTGAKLAIAKNILEALLNYFLDPTYSKKALQNQLQQFIDDLPKKKQRLRKNQSSQLSHYLQNLKNYVQVNFPDQKPLQAMAGSQSRHVVPIINRIDSIQKKCNQQLTIYLDKDKTHNKLDRSKRDKLQQQSKTDINGAVYQQVVAKNIQNLDNRLRNCEQTNNSNQDSKYKEITIEQLRKQNAEKATRYDNCEEAVSGFKKQDASIISNFQPEELKKSFENIKTEQPRCPFVNYHNELERVAPAAKSTTANKSNDNKQEIDSDWFERVFNSEKPQASSDFKLTSKNKVGNISDLIRVGFLNLNENWKGKDNELTDRARLWQQFANQVDLNKTRSSTASEQYGAEQANNTGEDAKQIRDSIPDALKNYFKQIDVRSQSNDLIDKVVDMVWQRLLNQGKKRWWPCNREVTKAANIFYELDNLCRSQVNDKTGCVKRFLENGQIPGDDQNKAQLYPQQRNDLEELSPTIMDLTDNLKRSTSMFSCFCFWKKDMATDLQKRLHNTASDKDTVSVALD